jgi:hypothetical protein
MSDAPAVVEKHTLILPAVGKIPELKLEMSKVVEAEQRILEAKMVNPLTYVDLESCFNESYRDLKRHLSSVGYQHDLADKALNVAKSNMLLDTYPEYLEKNDFKKSQDNGDLRMAFFMRDPDYLAALDRTNQLKALQSNLDGKIKVMENVCRYMRKQMDLILRSGLSNRDYYLTQGNKK